VTCASGRRAGGTLALLGISAAMLVTLSAGALVKEPCASGDWSDGRQYRRLCYSDLIPLYTAENLQGSRLPFLDSCPPASGNRCDEYPVLTMYLMRAAAWISTGYGGFFRANVLLLTLLALATGVMLFGMVGGRAVYFAFAPTLLLSAFLNWDLLAVALATGATLAYLRERDTAAGILIGLGGAAKLYPLLLLVPFGLGLLRVRRTRGALNMLAGAVVAYAAVDLPFALAAPHAWATFFRFNAVRGVDWDSVWFVACSRLHAWPDHSRAACSWSTSLINEVSIVVFVSFAAAVWFLRRARKPDFARWTFGFPLLVAFLLTNKVFSPQYGLWLLPWFPLALPSAPLFILFEAADVAVFVTRFSYFARQELGLGGVSLGVFQLALVARAMVLLACVVAWVLRTQQEYPEPSLGRRVGSFRALPGPRQ
jgi:uncharacterized membrane protein